MEKAVPFSGTIEEGCRDTGLNRNEVYELIASGEVLSYKLKRKRIIDLESLRQAVKRRMKTGIDPQLSELMARRRRKEAA